MLNQTDEVSSEEMIRTTTSGVRAPVSIVLYTVALSGFPLLLAVMYIAANGVNIPKSDEWTFLTWHSHLINGQIPLSQLITIENSEHKCAFAYFVMSLLTGLFTYNSVLLMYAELSCLLLACVLLVVSGLRAAKFANASAWLLLPVPWFLLNLKQWEGLLWGTCLIIGIAVLSVVACLLLLERSKKPDIYLVGAAVAAICASFTHSLGILLWPFGFVQTLLLTWFRRAEGDLDEQSIIRRYQSSLLWLCLSGVVIATYVLLPHATYPKHDGLKFLKVEPWAGVQFFLACLANPLSSDAIVAVSMGLVLCALFLSVFVDFVRNADTETRRLLITPGILALFGITTALLISYGRFAGNVEAAVTSRYFALLAFPIAGLYLACLILCKNGRTGGFVRLGILTGVLALGAISGDLNGEKDGYLVREERKTLANIIKNYRYQNPAELTEVTLAERDWQSQIALLEPRRWSVFGEANPPDLKKLQIAPMEGAFGLEKVNSISSHTYPLWRNVVIDSAVDRTLRFEGFAVSFKAKKPAEAVFVSLDGKIDIPATMGIAKPFVARKLKRRSFVESGFVACCDSSLPGRGVHSVSLKIVLPDGRSYFTYGPVANIEIR